MGAVIDLLALLIAAPIVSAIAVLRPAVRPHAVATITCAALYCARLVASPREVVAIFVVWPLVAVWLWARVTWGASGVRAVNFALPAVALYALFVATCGYHLRALWPWPIMAPNLAPLACACAWWRRPRTWAARSALVLPASCAADLVTTWLGSGSDAREWVGAITWVVFAACVWRARRD